MTIQTTTLNDGTRVLAKNYKGQWCAVTYANHTQAEAKAQALQSAGIHAVAIHPRFSGPRYIEITQ